MDLDNLSAKYIMTCNSSFQVISYLKLKGNPILWSKNNFTNIRDLWQYLHYLKLIYFKNTQISTSVPGGGI